MIVLDLEADGLRPSHIWCCCCYEPDTDSFKVFYEDQKQDCKAYLESQDLIVAHNGIMYDFPVLSRLWDIHIPVKNIYDTVVASRLADPKRESGHSLKEWGKKLGVYKDHYEDWSHWTQEMEDYCCQDCRVCYAVYKELQKELQGFSTFSVQIEMRSQWLLSKQHYNGFDFDMDAAIALKNKMEVEYLQLLQKLQKAFPPRKNLIGQYKARRRLDGSLTAKSAEIITRDTVEPTDTPDLYNVYEWKEFIIDSPSEIRERLAPYWHPVIWNKPTKDGAVTAKVCDANLETVGPDAPEEIKDIVRCKILKSRSTLVQSFIDACWEDNRVHGDVISCGAASHRMSHMNPNTANIASFKSLYGKECRALFKAPEGKVLVGVDLAQIQLRVLAHYCNDQELIRQISEGDIHTHLAGIYGLITEGMSKEQRELGRARGKTVTYAILMGAGNAKIGQLLGGDKELGSKTIKNIERSINGWAKFKRHIEARAKIGWFTALDGRHVKLANAHLGMSYYLQSFEQAIIKYSMYLYHKKLNKLGIDFKQVSIVHDEFQVECRPEDAEVVGKTIAESMTEAGEFFKTRIRIEGEYKTGPTWLETH